jgi:hypothetical protein
MNHASGKNKEQTPTATFVLLLVLKQRGLLLDSEKPEEIPLRQRAQTADGWRCMTAASS